MSGFDAALGRGQRAATEIGDPLQTFALDVAQDPGHALAARQAIERVVIRPVENSPVLAVVVVFIALLVILNSITGWIYTYTIKTFPSPFPEQPLFGNRYMSSHEIGAICVTLVVLALLYAFFRFTPLGLAMRAAAQNPESGRLVGIRVGWMLALGWGLAAAGTRRAGRPRARGAW